MNHDLLCLLCSTYSCHFRWIAYMLIPITRWPFNCKTVLMSSIYLFIYYFLTILLLLGLWYFGFIQRVRLDILQSGQCNILSLICANLPSNHFCLYLVETLLWQVKVFSRVEEVFKAMKNYTIKAIPEDPSSLLQQVRSSVLNNIFLVILLI